MAIRYNETVTAEIRAELRRQDRSQRQLAQALGWSTAYLNRRLNDHVSLSIPDVETIAAALDVPRARLLGLRQTRRAS